MIAVDARGKLRSVQFSKSLVDAFFASTGTTASTAIAAARQLLASMSHPRCRRAETCAKKGDSRVATPLENIVPGAS